MKEKCDCGEKHAEDEEMLEAMKDLQKLVNKWADERGLIASDILFVIVSFLVQSADEQEIPSAAIQSIKDLLENEFMTPAEERSFGYTEPH